MKITGEYGNCISPLKLLMPVKISFKYKYIMTCPKALNFEQTKIIKIFTKKPY